MATALVALVAACGGESDEESVARAIAEDLRSEEAFSGDISIDEARCVGDAIVEDLGPDDARTLGRPDGGEAEAEAEADDDPRLQLDALADDEISAIGSAMDDCVADLEAIVVDLIAQGITDAPDDGFPVDEAEARCIGDLVASQVSFSRLLTVGLQGDGDLGDLSDDEAVVFGEAFADCVDVRGILLEQVARSGADAAVVSCLDDQISDEAIEMLFVETFAGGTASAEDAFAVAIDACT